MDKSWINLPSRANAKYVHGVINFLDFAFENSQRDEKIACPCVNCVNICWLSRNEVFDHLIVKGFLKTYVTWTCHGEVSNVSSSVSMNDDEIDTQHDIQGLLDDVFNLPSSVHEDVGLESTNLEDETKGLHLDSSEDKTEFYLMLKEAEQPLYPGCEKYTKLSFLVELFHLKCLHGWSDKSFSMQLEMYRKVLPSGNLVPESYYAAKKIMRCLGLSYEQIHVCPNDCMLFWKDKASDDSCTICGASRWVACSNEANVSVKKKKKPVKVLRWFPLVPRLQRLFLCSETATLMKWHDECRTNDGNLRHPADSQVWKDFDVKYPDFASDSRNVRLGLASDGFNPFKTMSVAYSTWPVILIPYNLPPWICMKQSNFILSLLIPGPKAPGNKIDVYLQPLIEELLELFVNGIDALDASTKQRFRLHAALMWTINDFPAYGSLSGWGTRGKYACPCCGYGTESIYLRNSGKYCFTGHRRWLDSTHKFRDDRRSFMSQEVDHRELPTRPSGSFILRQLESLIVGDHIGSTQNWKKKSVFFNLPYWEHQLVRHNLDVMHIEKNVFDNIIGTIMGQAGKSKDNIKARLDLEWLGIRKELHPKKTSSGKLYCPKACYQMTKKEIDSFLKVLKDVVPPDELSSNISRCVNLKDRKLYGLKSYDFHVLMQELLPIVIRRSLPDGVSSIIIDMCNFFKELCSKTLHANDLERLQQKVAITLCQLEKIFPPSFFTVMVHLVIHLPEEAKLAGPVCYRWMYPIERYLATLKGYVRNRARPEGSIAEGYIAEECLLFCSRYLSNVETRFNRPRRNDDIGASNYGEMPSIMSIVGRPLGKQQKHNVNLKKRKRDRTFMLDDMSREQAHRYVLFNHDTITPFRNQHKDVIRRQNRGIRPRPTEFHIEQMHCETFPNWFKQLVKQMIEQDDDKITEEIKWLSAGPLHSAKRYTGYMVNGYRFHTKKREYSLKTQNSGICITANSSSYASQRDNNPINGEVDYYGVLTDIIKLNYSGRYSVVMFRCDWVHQSLGLKKDQFGLKLLNFSYLIHKGDRLADEPFVLASQVSKCFYVKDERDKDWVVVKHVKVRDYYDIGDGQNNDTQLLQEGVLFETTNLLRNEADDDEMEDIDDIEVSNMEDDEDDEDDDADDT